VKKGVGREKKKKIRTSERIGMKIKHMIKKVLEGIMKLMKKLFYGITYLSLFTKILAFNIGIAPTGFYTSLDKNETHEIMVTNNTLQPVRVEISAEAATGWEKYNRKDMMKIYPKSITLKPNGSRSVRFAVRGAKDLPEGEYKAKLIFKEVGSKPQEISQKLKTEDGQDVDVKFELLTELHLAAYGLKGNRKVQGQLINSQIKNDGKEHYLKKS
jgi:P pilus assembly chaperone PapD